MFLNCAKNYKVSTTTTDHKLNNLLNKTEALKQKNKPQQQIMLPYDEMYKEQLPKKEIT